MKKSLVKIDTGKNFLFQMECLNLICQFQVSDAHLHAELSWTVGQAIGVGDTYWNKSEEQDPGRTKGGETSLWCWW